ncbi:MAG: hypothetical protein HC945_03505 [Nitrosarchaeum sp.]|nr:hypothetical protein [Nitrosarchaeum sp.]
MIRELRSSKLILGVRDEGEWLRVRWRSREVLKRLTDPKKGLFATKEIKVFEADVDPVRRFMIDTDGEVDRPRRIWVDIEADSRVPFAMKSRARILCISLVDVESDLRWTLCLDEDTDEDERRLLGEFWSVLSDYDQIVAWNGDRYDFHVIRERTKLRGFKVDPKPLAVARPHGAVPQDEHELQRVGRREAIACTRPSCEGRCIGREARGRRHGRADRWQQGVGALVRRREAATEALRLLRQRRRLDDRHRRCDGLRRPPADALRGHALLPRYVRHVAYAAR